MIRSRKDCRWCEHFLPIVGLLSSMVAAGNVAGFGPHSDMVDSWSPARSRGSEDFHTDRKLDSPLEYAKLELWGAMWVVVFHPISSSSVRNSSLYLFWKCSVDCLLTDMFVLRLHWFLEKRTNQPPTNVHPDGATKWKTEIHLYRSCLSTYALSTRASGRKSNSIAQISE